MTLAQFAARNCWRSKRRSILTILSLGFSFLLLTLMMTIWRTFYIDPWSTVSARHIVCRHRVSLALSLPSYYRDKIRSLPGVVDVIPLNLFDSDYKGATLDDFSKIGTDPNEYLNAYPEYQIPPEQVAAWKKDPAGAIAGSELAQQHHWKLGDRLTIQGGQLPVTVELNLRGTFKSPFPVRAIYFPWAYVQQAAHYAKDQLYLIQADSPESVSRISREVDSMFHNSPEPTRTEAEQAFDIGLIAMFGNVKAFILSICLAVLFATLLVSGNTLAMSIRERTREVAMMRSLGFTPGLVRILFFAEAATLAVSGWLFGTLAAYGLVFALAHARAAGPFAVLLKIPLTTLAVSLPVAGLVALASAAVPSYRASRVNIVQGLRHVG
ncbi:MAG TPA: FtsX-like permease family protein [Candidatus Sulfotelmatobacter sp.]|nr:FtsX-like permease family protein [Candidatus Sulfotelmatobacter sp.]